MRGHELGGRYSQDPIGSDAPRGKNREQRKHRNDGTTWTPTEARLREASLKQFCHLEGSTNSEAYRTSPAWCVGCNGRRLAEEDGKCEGCLRREYEESTSEPTINGLIKWRLKRRGVAGPLFNEVCEVPDWLQFAIPARWK